MANCCMTDISIIAEPNEIDILWHHLQKASAFECNNKSTPGWLGNIVEYCGKSYKDYECRGIIDDAYKPDSTCIHIFVEDAWEPHLDPFKLLIKTFAPKAQLSYVATEPGNGLYETNDPDYAEKYIIDDMVGGYFDDCDYFEPLFTEEGLRSELLRFLNDSGMENKTLQEIIDEVEERTEYNVGIHMYEYAEA